MMAQQSFSYNEFSFYLSRTCFVLGVGFFSLFFASMCYLGGTELLMLAKILGPEIETVL